MKKKILTIAAILILCMIAVGFSGTCTITAYASDSSGSLTEGDFKLDLTNTSIYTGNQLSLSIISEVSESEYKVEWDISNPDILQDTNEYIGQAIKRFTGAGVGTATITATVYQEVWNAESVSYIDEIVGTYSCEIEVKARTVTLNDTSLTLVKDQSGVKLTPYIDPIDRVTSISYTASNTNVMIDQEGNITANAAGTAVVYIKVSFHDTAEEIQAECQVTVLDSYISRTSLACAVGATRTLTVKNANGSAVKWSSSNPSIVMIDSATGKVDAVKTGRAVIYADVTTKSGHTCRISVQMQVTNPRFSKNKLALAVNYGKQLSITGTGSDSSISWWKSSSTAKASVYNGKVSANKKGTVTISARVDYKTIKCTVVITNPKVKNPTLILVKGKKGTLNISGTNSASTVKFKSKNKNIATVTSKGRVKAIKYGSACIEVTIDGKTFYCTVAVGKTKAVKAVKKGYTAMGATYSQAYRMLNGYYDCSSFTWRSYSPYGIKMGSKYWAPTAAMQALYFKQQNKVIAYNGVSESKLRVGDLLYFDCDPTPNGRYLGIDHVAMYVGNGKIIHANGTTMSVAEGSYQKLKPYIVLIARPVK